MIPRGVLFLKKRSEPTLSRVQYFRSMACDHQRHLERLMTFSSPDKLNEQTTRFSKAAGQLDKIPQSSSSRPYLEQNSRRFKSKLSIQTPGTASDC